MPGKMRRLIGRSINLYNNLYKLLWVEDRLAALEAQGTRLRDQGTRLRDQGTRLRDQGTRLQDRISALQERQDLLKTQLQDQGTGLQTQIDQTYALYGQVKPSLEHLIDQVDLLKSSLEVPQEWIEEFHEWRAHNPIPEEPLVSVTVATYNRARLLTERCIPSVLNQTYGNLELIVVGDACTDETEEAVAEIEDPRLTFINLPQRGSYPTDPERRWMVAGTPAMNQGLTSTRGYFITHLDDDDEYVPDRLEKLVQFVSEEDCDFVWHPFWFETNADEWTLSEAWEFTFRQITTGSVFYRSWFKKLTWDSDAHRLMEPGDWNRFRRIKYINPVYRRYPKPLLKHYKERSQSQ